MAGSLLCGPHFALSPCLSKTNPSCEPQRYQAVDTRSRGVPSSAPPVPAMRAILATTTTSTTEMEAMRVMGAAAQRWYRLCG